MMKINKSDVIWGYVSLILVQSVNVLLLPFIIKYLNPSEIGLWYTFTTFYSLAILIDFGFQSVISRNVSYLWAGAQEIKKDSIADDFLSNNTINKPYFSKFLYTSKIIYRTMSVIVFVLLSTFGTYYIYIISVESLNIKVTLISWLFYFASIILNIYYSYWNAFIKGIGAIKKYNQILIITKITQLIFTVMFLTLGFNLIGVSLAYLISVLINRVLQGRAFYSFNNVTKSLKKDRKYLKFDKVIFKNLLPNTTKTAAISFSNYLIINFPILLSSYFLSLKVSGQFGFLNQIITLILTISNSYFNTYLSKINYLKAKNRSNEVLTLFKKAIIINICINLLAFLFMIIFGNYFLHVLHSNVYLPGLTILLITIIYRYLYNNQTLFTTLLSAGNNLYYYKYFLLFALITVAAQLVILINYKNLYSIILPIFTIQLLFNNWYWVYIVIKEAKGDKNVINE